MPDRKPAVRAVVALLLTFFAGSAHAQIELISRVHPSLIPDTAGGETPSISADGRYVAFHSYNGNILPERPTAHSMGQVYLYDRQTGARTLVSRTPTSATAGGDSQSHNAVLSADGRFVVYASFATDLIAGQAAPFAVGANLFLFDRAAGTTVLVSHASSSQTTFADGYSVDPVISADGRYVVFASSAENLVAGQTDLDSSLDVFLYDRLSGTIALVSHEAGAPTTAVGGFFPAISADGAYITFFGPSEYEDLYHLFLYEVASGTITLVSRRSDDPAAGEFVSFDTLPALSADGRFIAFTSSGEHLVPGQTESDLTRDVFVFDRVTGTTALASRKAGSAATTGNGRSEAPVLSADGRYVAFVSWATDLVSGQSDSAGTPDVFLHDLTLGSTMLVSRQSNDTPTVAQGAAHSPRISADGSQVVFIGDRASTPTPGQPFGLYNLYLFERATGIRRWISHPAGLSDPDAIRSAGNAVINADGGYVAYSSISTDLVAGLQDTNGANDAFLYSRASEGNTVLSRRDPGASDLSAPGLSDTPLISADGRFVAYVSSASRIVPGFASSRPETLYLHDRQTGVTIAVASDGFNQLIPLGISGDGRHLTFQSSASDLVSGQVDFSNTPDLFSYNRIAGTITLLSRTAASPVTGGSFAQGGRVTPDGRYISFLSSASNLVPGQVDRGGRHTFLHDRVTGTTELIDHAIGAPAQEANGDSLSAAVSADGRYVAWVSFATDLVSGMSDDGGATHLFLRDRRNGTTTLLSHSFGAPGTPADGSSFDVAFSANGRCLAFTSWASNLLPGMGASQGVENVFLYSLITGSLTLVSHAHGAASTGGNHDSWAPSPSADCSAVTFKSHATNLFAVPPPGLQLDQVFLVLAEPVLGTLTLLGRGLGGPGYPYTDSAPVMSEDGHFAAFFTRDDLLQGGTDPYSSVYLFDRVSREVVLVSRALGSPTTPGDDFSFQYSLSSDGRSVAFTSSATNLVANDYGSAPDVFVFDNELATGGDFHTLAPCRLLDTRQPEDGPILTSGTPVIFEVDGGCGIPATARALALNVTVFNPAGQGNLSLGPGDAAASGTSSINFLSGMNRANNAIVPLSLDGSASIAVRPFVAGGGTVHVILDVVGWFE